MNWLQQIERRRSVRKFEPDMDPATVARVKDLCQVKTSLNESPLELKVLPGSQVHGVIRGYLASYGRVLSPWYIAAICSGSREALLNLGYCTQRVILEMTALGLGTCWIGGFFDKNTMNTELNVGEDEGVRALVAWGRPGKGKNFAGKKAGKRVLPEKIAVFDSDSITDGLPWRAVLEAVRWAPSAINRQPWRLWFTAEGVHLFSAAGRIARAYTPIDIGIALCHLELACRQLAIPGQLSVTEHPQRRGWEYWASFVRE